MGGNNRNRRGNKKHTQAPEINKNPARRPTHTKQANVVDYLCEDEEISSQRYVCLSFASITPTMKEEIITNISGQTNQPVETVKTIVEKWCEQEHPKRAVKVRGSAGTVEDILNRAKRVRELDDNFHIFTCEVGKWLCFDPDPELIEDENYMEQQLNELVKGYKQNQHKSKTFFEQRRRELMEKAIAEGTPEGQQLKMLEAEPVQAIEQRIEQADEYIKELEDKINQLKKTKDLSERKLDTIKSSDDSPSLASGEELKVASRPDHISADKDTIATLRDMQEQAKNAELSDLAKELANRQAPPQAPPQAPQQGQLANSGTNQYNEMDKDVIIPSQIRYNYESRDL